MSGEESKVALVTGAASGIGRSVATLLAAEGYTLALSDRDESGLNALAESLLIRGTRVRAYSFDLSDVQAARQTVRSAEEQLGPIQALALVAGVLHMGTPLSVSVDAWQETFAVNTMGALHLVQSVLPFMIERRRGAVVAVASNAARTPRVNMAAYGASKAALVMLIKCLALEVAQYGIRCNTVSPGSTDTPMQRKLWNDENSAQSVIAGDPSRFRLGIPLGRIAEPQDVAEVVSFLLSERARHITMQDLCVDGGATL